MRVDVRRRASQQPRQLPEADAKTHAWSDASPDASKSNSTAIAVSFAAPHGVSDAEAYTDSYAAADARTQQAPDAATLVSEHGLKGTSAVYTSPATE